MLFILQYSYYANILGGMGSAVRGVLAFHQFEPGLNVSNPGGDAYDDEVYDDVEYSKYRFLLKCIAVSEH